MRARGPDVNYDVRSHGSRSLRGRVDVEDIRDSFTIRVLQSLRPVAVDSYVRVDERGGRRRRVRCIGERLRWRAHSGPRVSEK